MRLANYDKTVWFDFPILNPIESQKNQFFTEFNNQECVEALLEQGDHVTIYDEKTADNMAIVGYQYFNNNTARVYAYIDKRVENATHALKRSAMQIAIKFLRSISDIDPNITRIEAVGSVADNRLEQYFKILGFTKDCIMRNYEGKGKDSALYSYNKR